MGALTVERNENKEFSPKDIREMLGVNNSQIQALCKYADIRLKKNDRGLTYFTDEDVKILKSFSDNGKICSIKTVDKLNSTSDISYFNKLFDMIGGLEKTVTEKVANVLDEKLDGMDDVVMELIRVKSENENMRFKINELNKENYRLKKEINSFKKVPFGFYTKTNQDTNLF